MTYAEKRNFANLCHKMTDFLLNFAFSLKCKKTFSFPPYGREEDNFKPEIKLPGENEVRMGNIALQLLNSPVLNLGQSLPTHTALYRNPINVFPKIKLRGLVPNSYIHVSVSDLFNIFSGLVCLFGYSKICRPTMGIYKSLTDT
jgi:hypothetical protein